MNHMFNFYLGLYNEYIISLFFFNIIVYVLLLTLFFSLFFLFDLRFFKTLNELKGLANYSFVTSSIILLILSMSGIPPFFGFVSKFLLFIFIFFKKQFFLIFFLIFFNFFAMYFYIQNIRYLTKKNNTRTPFVIKQNNVFLNFSLVFLIVILNFINIFGLLFTEDVFIFLSYMFNFLFIE